MSHPSAIDRALAAQPAIPRSFNHLLPGRGHPLGNAQFGNQNVGDFAGAGGVFPSTEVFHDNATQFGNGGIVSNDRLHIQYLVRTQFENGELGVNFEVMDSDYGDKSWTWSYTPRDYRPGSPIIAVAWGTLNYLISYDESIRKILAEDDTYETFDEHFRYIGNQINNGMRTNVQQVGKALVYQFAKRSMAPNVFCGMVKGEGGEYARPYNLMTGDHCYAVLRKYERRRPTYDSRVDTSFSKRSRLEDDWVQYWQLDPWVSSVRQPPPMSVWSGTLQNSKTEWVGKYYFLGVVVDTRGNTTNDMAADNIRNARAALYPKRRDASHWEALHKLPEIEIFLRQF